MHKRFQDLLPFYVKGLLAPEEYVLLEQHLDECATCREDIEQWRRVAMAINVEAANWIPNLVQPSLTLSHRQLRARHSNDGSGRLIDVLPHIQPDTRVWNTTRIQRIFPAGLRQRLVKPLTALAAASLIICMLSVLILMLHGAKGTGKLGGPQIRERAVTPTIIPSPTSTLTATPVPPPSIAPSNAAQLTQIAKLGYGYSTDVVWSPNGRILAVGTSTDVLLYDADSLTVQPRELGVTMGEITSIAFSPDGTLLAIGGQRGTVLWDVIAGQARDLQLSEGGVLRVMFSTDGARFAAQREDGLVRIWDATTGSTWVSGFAGINGKALSIAFGPDGKTLAFGSDDEKVYIGDVMTSQIVATLKGHTSEVVNVAYSPDGKILASGGDDNTVRLWNTDTHDALNILEGHSQDIASLVFSPDGTLLTSGSYDNSARLWDVATGKELSVLEGHTGDVRTIAFSPDGTLLATASNWEDSTLRLWDVTTGESVAVLEGCARNAHAGEVSKIAFSPDGDRMAATCGGAGVMVWHVRTQLPYATSLHGYGDAINSLAFSADGRLLAAGGGNGFESGTVRLWDVETGIERTVLHGHTAWVRSVAISPDGTLLASGSGDRTARLWNIGTVETIRTLGPLSDGVVSGVASFGDDDGDFVAYPDIYSDAVWSVAFSPDGTLLAVGRGDPMSTPGSFQIYDVATGEIRLDIEPLAEPSQFLPEPLPLGVYSLAFSPDGTLLATVNGHGIVQFWDVQTGEERAALQHTPSCFPTRLAFSSDGTLLATGGSCSDCGWGEVCSADQDTGQVQVWDVATRNQVTLVDTLFGGVSSIAFNRDGTLIAFGGGWQDGKVSLWDTAAKETLAVLDSPYVTTIAFSPNGIVLATGGNDSVVYVWGVASK